MFVWATDHIVGLAVASGALGVVGIVLGISALASASRANRRARRRTPVDSTDTAGHVDALHQDIQDLQEQIIQLQRDLSDAQEALKLKVGTPQVLRFNAFGDIGSDQSFSVAFVDESKTGIVISSIYGREESRTYAKPILQGESKYPLTEEEIAVLNGKTGSEETGRRRRPVFTQ